MASGVPRDVTKLYGSLVCPSSVVIHTELCVLFELRLALSGRIFGIGADKVSMLLNIFSEHSYFKFVFNNNKSQVILKFKT